MPDSNPDIYRTRSADQVSYGKFFPLLEELQPFFFYTRNVDGSIDSVCPRIINVLGYSQEDFIANYKSLLTEELRTAEGLQIIQKSLTENLAINYIIGIKKNDESRAWLQMREITIMEGEEIKAAKGVACDVSNLIKYENKIKVIEGRFREMSEAAPIGILQIDPDDNIAYLNTHAQTIFGKSLGQILGQKWWDTIYPDDQEELFKIWAHCENSGEEFSWEGRVQRPDGSVVWIRFLSRFLHHDWGKVSYSTIEDITDKKEIEHQLQIYSEELKRSNDALSEFSSIASHDLKEPLRKIITFSHYLRDNCSYLKDKDEQFLIRITSAAERMQKFIDALLEYSKITFKVKPFQEINLNKLVHEIVSDLEVRVKESSATIKIEQLPTIMADDLQMRQLFQNIIGNSLKFFRKEVSHKLTIRCNSLEGGLWEILIEDNGAGFDQKYSDKIFKPFERLHGRSEYEGTGMGLAICKKIVERHHGKISAESEKGTGSTFKIILPEKQ